MPLLGKKLPGSGLNWVWETPHAVVEVPWDETLILLNIPGGGFYVVEEPEVAKPVPQVVVPPVVSAAQNSSEPEKRRPGRPRKLVEQSPSAVNAGG